MESFYTIIKIAPNSAAGDSLSIGLLLRDGLKFWLQFSAEKKSLAKQLLRGKGDIVDFVVKQIEQKVSEMNVSLSSRTELFELGNLLTSDRFTHLSVYSNGVLRFSEPSFLNDTINEQKFEKLFNLLVDKTVEKEIPEYELKDTKFRQIIQDKLINRVENQIHTNLDLTPNRLPGLYFNFNIDCLGLNGALIGAKSIPFYKKNETIDRELSHYFSLISILNLMDLKRSPGDDKFFVIGDEPSDVNSKEHRTWENIKNNRAVLLINSEQVDEVAEEIEVKKATKFLAI